MWEYLISIDRSIFAFFNQSLASSRLDPLINFISDETVLFSFAFLALVPTFLKGDKSLRRFALSAILLVIFLDNLSYLFIKPGFASLRPCFAEASVRLATKGCGGLYGFPSNHATNSMAIAALFFFWSQKSYRYLGIIFAFIISLTRVYLGVHYPSDILGGMTLGFLAALIFYSPFYFKILPKG